MSCLRGRSRRDLAGLSLARETIKPYGRICITKEESAGTKNDYYFILY